MTGQETSSEQVVPARLGFIGLGNMGGAIAEGLLADEAAGDVVVGYDISEEAMARLIHLGGVAGASPADVARQCDLVGVVVIDDAQVRTVCEGPDGAIAGAAESGALLAVHSTVLPATVAELAAQADAVGVTVIDAPVTGGVAAALARDLVVFCGGNAAHTERGRPLFSHYAGLVKNMGPLGSGLRAKVARNLITYAEMAVAAEAVHLAAAAGVDLESFAEIVNYSDRHIGTHAGAFQRRVSWPPPSLGPNFARIAHKDLGGALALAAECDVTLPITDLVDRSIAAYHGDPD